MKRNEFLRKGVLTVFAMSAAGQVVKAMDGSFTGNCETI